MGAETARRGETARCVACGVHCDAYFCDWCGQASGIAAARHADDRRAMTATRVGQHERWRIERAMDLEQLSAIVSCISPTVAEEDDNESKRVRALLHNNYLPHFSPAELAQWEDKLERLGAIYSTPYGTEMRMKSREHVHRRRYQRFCEMWSTLGLKSITEAVEAAAKPLPRKRRPFVSSATIDAIEERTR